MFLLVQATILLIYDLLHFYPLKSSSSLSILLYQYFQIFQLYLENLIIYYKMLILGTLINSMTNDVLIYYSLNYVNFHPFISDMKVSFRSRISNFNFYEFLENLIWQNQQHKMLSSSFSQFFHYQHYSQSVVPIHSKYQIG